ncbi:uncharacterized protein LOC129914950 [Episyrphus balteatus]|uniref:uncharacterized protein LOC129914950 n=1 Tax=Episyrphus balteatus TaxID=286459 RepID=UPI00248513A9|nr:uncharacterized protein LOC129914950 [Episyrphus balteatus]
MLDFVKLLKVTSFFILFGFASVTSSKTHLDTFNYCIRDAENQGLKSCMGKTAISFLQSFNEQDNFTVFPDLIAEKDESVASRSIVNFLDQDPVDFRGIMESAGALFSERSLQWRLDNIYPGLMFKIGPSADSNSVAEFVMDPKVDERFYAEPSSAKILTKQYLLPMLLGFKFNLVVFIPILFGLIVLFLKKSLFLVKVAMYISSILGVGGAASLGSPFGFGGGVSGGVGGGWPPILPGFGAPGAGLYPAKDSLSSNYQSSDSDIFHHDADYSRKDRSKVVFTVSGKRDTLTAHSVGQSFAKCLGDPSIGKCFQKEAIKTLDVLLYDNSTWQYSEFIEFEKDPNFTVSDLKSGRFVNNNGSPSDIIAEKLLQLAQARSIRMKMNPKGLETKVDMDGLDNNNFEEGGLHSRKKQQIWYLNHSLKGRKKKDKKGGMAMMGGLAMIAMMAQMFLGKVLLIAGAAFVMSKIAMLLSVLTSLKSKLSGGGSTDHVVTIDSGGGHGHSGGGHSGWHRSLPYITPSPPIHFEPAEEEHHEIEHHHEEEHHEIPQISEYYSHHDTSSQKDDYKFI